MPSKVIRVISTSGVSPCSSKVSLVNLPETVYSTWYAVSPTSQSRELFTMPPKLTCPAAPAASRASEPVHLDRRMTTAIMEVGTIYRSPPLSRFPALSLGGMKVGLAFHLLFSHQLHGCGPLQYQHRKPSRISASQVRRSTASFRHWRVNLSRCSTTSGSSSRYTTLAADLAMSPKILSRRASSLTASTLSFRRYRQTARMAAKAARVAYFISRPMDLG